MDKKLVLLVISFMIIVCSEVLANDKSVFLGNNPVLKDTGKVVFDWTPYIRKIDASLKSNWFPPKSGHDVEISFKVTHEGKYKDLKIINPSKNIKDNQAALDAVMFTFPIEPIPATANEIEIKYTFPGKIKEPQLSNNQAIQVYVIN